MKAELKSLHSPDIDLHTFVPSDESSISFLVQAFIGPVGVNSEESFDLVVCTPDWIKSKYPNQSLPITNHLIVSEFDLKSIEDHFKKICETCTGEDWNEIAKKIASHAIWEFQDYKPSP